MSRIPLRLTKRSQRRLGLRERMEPAELVSEEPLHQRFSPAYRPHPIPAPPRVSGASTPNRSSTSIVDNAIGALGGAVLGALAGGLAGSPALGAIVGAAAGVGAQVATAGGSKPADAVGSFPESWGELAFGPGPMTPERMFLAMNYQPDQWGWAALPTTQSAMGPALANTPPCVPIPGGQCAPGTGFGPAYLMLPANATMAQPPGYAFQQDVSHRAAEAARVLAGHMRRSGIEILQAVRPWPGAPRAYGTTYKPGWGEQPTALRLAKSLANQANLHAVLFAGTEPGTFTIHFTDNPGMLMAAARGMDAQTQQIAGFGDVTEALQNALGGPTASSRLAKYVLGGIAGGVAAAYVGQDKKGDVKVAPVILGTGAGLILTRLTDEGPIPASTSIEGDIAHDALAMVDSSQASRLFTIGVWGPATIWAATRAKNPALATLLGVGGAAMIAGSVDGYFKTRALRARLAAAVTRAPREITREAHEIARGARNVAREKRTAA